CMPRSTPEMLEKSRRRRPRALQRCHTLAAPHGLETYTPAEVIPAGPRGGAAAGRNAGCEVARKCGARQEARISSRVRGLRCRKRQGTKVAQGTRRGGWYDF